MAINYSNDNENNSETGNGRDESANTPETTTAGGANNNNGISIDLISWLLLNADVVVIDRRTPESEKGPEFNKLREALQVSSGYVEHGTGSSKVQLIPVDEGQPTRGITIFKEKNFLIGGGGNRSSDPSKFKRLKYTYDGLEIMSVIYESFEWVGAGSEERVVDIYVPQKEERIGYIKFSNDFRNGARIFNCITGEEFITRIGGSVVTGDSPSYDMKVEDSAGLAVAVTQATHANRTTTKHYGGLCSTHTDWKFSKFQTRFSSHNMSSITSKAIILAASNMMVTDYFERTYRKLPALIDFIVCLAIIAGAIAIIIYAQSN